MSFFTFASEMRQIQSTRTDFDVSNARGSQSQVHWTSIQIHIRQKKLNYLMMFHTLQLNFLFSDWLFSKYAECIENFHCIPRTANRLREMLLVRDHKRERHIDWSIFSRVNLLIFFMFSAILSHFIYDFSRT